MSLDTVYRALWLLSELGLITTLGPPRERTRFDANLRRHHHFVCRECGLIRDFYSNAFDELRLPQSLKAMGSIETTHVEARGLCIRFWNVQGRHEVDFVVTHGRRSIAIEIKSGTRFGDHDLARLQTFSAKTPGVAASILAYNGTEAVQLGERLLAIPIGLILS